MAKRSDKSEKKTSKNSGGRPVATERQRILEVIAGPGETSFFMSGDIEHAGQATFLVVKLPERGHGVMAHVLVDNGIPGVKDIWSESGADRRSLDQMVKLFESQGMPIRESTAEELLRWTLGGLRWASEHGLRLPKDWPLVAALLGVAEDAWKTAGIDGFVKVFAGHPEDLRLRLVSGSFDEFIRRPDIRFVFDARAPYLADHETGDYANAPAPLDELDDDKSAPPDELDDAIDEMLAALSDDQNQELEDQAVRVGRHLCEMVMHGLARAGIMPSPQMLQFCINHMMVLLLTRHLPPTKDPIARLPAAYARLRRIVDESVPDDRFEAYMQASDQYLVDFASRPENADHLGVAMERGRPEPSHPPAKPAGPARRGRTPRPPRRKS